MLRQELLVAVKVHQSPGHVELNEESRMRPEMSASRKLSAQAFSPSGNRPMPVQSPNSLATRIGDAALADGFLVIFRN
jgi:hypothetical protein